MQACERTHTHTRTHIQSCTHNLSVLFFPTSLESARQPSRLRQSCLSVGWVTGKRWIVHCFDFVGLWRFILFWLDGRWAVMYAHISASALSSLLPAFQHEWMYCTTLIKHECFYHMVQHLLCWMRPELPVILNFCTFCGSWLLSLHPKGFKNLEFIVFVDMQDKHKWLWFNARQKGRHLHELMLPRSFMMFIRSSSVALRGTLACTDTVHGKAKKLN